jgi:hypothetical protein
VVSAPLPLRPVRDRRVLSRGSRGRRSARRGRPGQAIVGGLGGELVGALTVQLTLEGLGATGSDGAEGVQGAMVVPGGAAASAHLPYRGRPEYASDHDNQEE